MGVFSPSLLVSIVSLAVSALSCKPAPQGPRGESAITAAPQPLSKEPGLNIDPAISADGRWLAFASDPGGSGFLHL